MCGICGTWGNSDARSVVRMITAMRHRGPDDSGVYHEAMLNSEGVDGVVLGMTRLAVIDPSSAGHQPMQNAAGSVCLVYNGEVYNYASERRLLEAHGYEFTSSSDTEIVLRMYEHYGDDFLMRLRGMFALAVYDRRGGEGRERLLLARDHFGIKPLVYAWVKGKLIFASEIKALLASRLVEPEIDPIALRTLLTYGAVYQPRTILRGVNMLLPAHRMIIDHRSGAEGRIERYWSLEINRRPELRRAPYKDAVAEVGRVIKEATRLQMVSDVPLGAFLSGGVDSSLLVAMMRGMVERPVKTFSVGFEGEGAEMDESGEAERTARFLGTDHLNVVVRGAEVRDSIGQIARSLDQPSVNGVNSYFVSRAARQAVTVAISGTGGDELFAGYPAFIKMQLEARRQRQASVWQTARGAFAGLTQRQAFDPLLLLPRGGERFGAFRENGGFTSKYGVVNTIFGARRAACLIAPELRRAAQAGRSIQRDLQDIDELPEGSPIERTSALCLRGYTANQLLRDIDAVAMAHSLEVRVPYLDPAVADVALSLPDEAKMGSLAGVSNLDQAIANTYRATGAKRILLDVARPLLPADFDLQTKRGFSMPFGAWMRGPLREVLRDTLADVQTRRRGVLHATEVASVRDKFLGGGSCSWAEPWLLMMLELWFREVIDKCGAPEMSALSTSPRHTERGESGFSRGAF